MLEATGVGEDEERIYRLLITGLETDPAKIGKQAGLDVEQTVAVLESLHAKGLVSRVSGSESGYAPTPPDVGFGPLLLRSQEQLEWARSAIAQLSEEYRSSVRRRDATQLVEVLVGQAAIRQQLRSLQLSARREIVWFCKAGHVAMPSSDNTEEFEALAKGVRYRVIYERALLEEPGMLDSVADGVARGEEARATSALPVRLAIADQAIALCPLVPVADGMGEPTAALVRDSNLLTALVALFERYWERSSPLFTEDTPVSGLLTADEEQLLSLLVAGVTDKAIASRLSVSQRTVQRRIADLLLRANAHTRAQLAWQAARLGWLDQRPATDTADG